MKALNLGCGIDIRQSTDDCEWVNLDMADLDGVDVVWDIDEFPWPFADGEFTKVVAFDIWEHGNYPLEFMREAHRILEPAGLLGIRTCAYNNENSYRDPTHKRWATRDTFRYWTPGHWLNSKYPHYADGAHFEEVSAAMVGDNFEFVLRKL